MSREYKMGYFIPVAPDKVAAWEDYRSKLISYRKEVNKLQDEIGASGVWLGIAGGVTGAKFDGEIHPAFSTRENRNGAHIVLSRGRSESQKQAIAEFNKRNEEVSALKPNPERLAVSHGFAFDMSYETEGGGRGNHSICSWIHPVQAAWFDPRGVIMIYAPDAKAAVEDFKECHARSVESHPDFSKPLTRIDNEDWKTPEGYERISESKWNLMKSTFEVAKEDAKANAG
jgi:hypothetical protein